MSTPNLPEVWLRGPLEGFAPVVMPAAHALLQVREDLERLARTVPDAQSGCGRAGPPRSAFTSATPAARSIGC